MERIRFTKVREVISPSRNNDGDAGLDFYIPTNLTLDDIASCNEAAENISLTTLEGGTCIVNCSVDEATGFITEFNLGPHSRILIPSGIRAIFEPTNSMLMAANKSGISTKKGLVFTAEIVDTPYTGEIHMGITNTSATSVKLAVGTKLIQFIHVPIYQTNPEEITNEEFETLKASLYTTRGDRGFGSGDEKI